MPNAGAPIYATDYQRWRVKAVQNTTQALAAATFTALTFDGADEVDDLNVHDSVTNNSRLVLGGALGWWLIIGQFAIGAASAKGVRSRIVVNVGLAGVQGGYSSTPNITGTVAGFVTSTSTSMWLATSAADYVQLQGYADVASSTVVSGDLRSTLMAIYQGPA